MTFEARGFYKVSLVAALADCHAALRLFGLELRRVGLSAEEINDCQATTFFPHLRSSPEVERLIPRGLVDEEPGDEWCEPQILIRLPDSDDNWPITPHVDVEPPWAAGRHYKAIVGLALTDVDDKGGALAVWPGSHRSRPGQYPEVVPQRAGDVVVMHPRLQHAGTLNLRHVPRVAIYFRLLGA